MEADMVDLEKLFSGPISYRIPQFQRPYAWKAEGQWKPLWEDVRKVAERYLVSRSGKKTLPHFMGAIVLQKQDNSVGEVTKRLVVDGQQRLTTLQILIKAAQHAFQTQDDIARSDRLRDLVVNKEINWGGDSDNETKIRQSNVNDQKAFQEAIRLDVGNDNSHLWLISEAYSFFKNAVISWLESDVEEIHAKADALEETLKTQLQIAAIELDKDEKPHIIFETLNARAEILLQSDLIKNTVMYEGGVVDDARRARELWGMFDDEWWRRDSGEGRLNRNHLDRFLNYWTVMRTYEDVTTKQVASRFRSLIEEEKRLNSQFSIAAVAKEVRSAGAIYKNIEENRIRGMETFLKRMKVMELGVVTPLLLWLFTSDVTADRRKRSIEALESYLVRRMLCGMQSQGFNRFFVSLLERLGTDGPGLTDLTIINYLANQTVENRIWPNDRNLSEDLTLAPMKGTVARRKMVLEAIEFHLRSNFAEHVSSTEELTIEHVMPKKWETNWPLNADSFNKIELETARNQAVGAIGNLTLTTGKLNSRLSNGPWIEKRDALERHSGLFLNKTLLHHAPANWDEEAIEGRSAKLAEAVLQIWPSADHFQEQLNSAPL